jgi:hypothetical protein
LFSLAYFPVNSIPSLLFGCCYYFLFVSLLGALLFWFVMFVASMLAMLLAMLAIVSIWAMLAMLTFLAYV